MRGLSQQKWFVWVTKYWFLFPIIGFLLLLAGVFFGYGESSYIAVHDNMDLFLAQYRMLKNTGTFWKHGVEVPFLGGISRDNLPSELSLYSMLYMIFPTYIAYVLGMIGKIILGIFSFRLLAKELYPDRYMIYRPVIYMIGFAYGIIWFFPAFGFAFASIPLCVYLLIKIYRQPEIGWYVALFAYPLVSYFSYHGIFILGYLVIAIVWLSIRDKKVAKSLIGALFVLAAGYVVCEYRLFGQMLLSDEVTIRSTIVNPSLSLPEVAAETVDVWRNGIFHADGVHGKVILPICLVYFVLQNLFYLFKKQWKKIFHDPFNFIMLFLVFNSVIYGLYDFEPLRTMVETLVPPLQGWQFNRTIFFNPFLWDCALFLILIRLYDRGIFALWVANGIICVAALVVIVTPTRYNDLYTTCYNKLYEYHHGMEVDAYNYEQFYAADLFAQIKEDIEYNGEWSVAYGLHPAVLEYNDIATLDGYLGFYSRQYKEDFRKIIAPALDRVEASRIYYDDWGARVYLYSGTDESVVSSAKTVHATDSTLYIDTEAFKALGGTYIFSRIDVSNTEELGLEQMGIYTAEDNSCTVYVYRVK
ncbi:MAG: DUF6044 family protein [Lachnospiraceae bacterium]|nr:DUF6044 family protein [Lachnospiraceae bacterium]